MTDWSKYKVVDLKEECKSRDIALTGLKLKQQFIDKLQEYESQKAVEPKQDDDDQDGEMAEEQPAPQANGDNSGPNGAYAANIIDDLQVPPVRDAQADEPQNHETTADASTIAPQEEAIHAEEQLESLEEPAHETTAVAAPAEDVAMSDALLVADPENLTEASSEVIHGSSADADQVTHPTIAAEVQENDERYTTAEQTTPSPKQAIPPTPQSTQIPSDSSTPRTSQIHLGDIAEDRKNRRKRSATPDPSTEEISRKRARLSEDAQEAKVETPLQDMQVDTKKAKEIRMKPTFALLEEPLVKKRRDDAAQDASPKQTLDKMPPRSPAKSRSPSEDRSVSPAIHPATCSLYISRLKRPIQPQAIRSHIISKAKSRSSDDSDPVTAFYLDSIKTHAFVSFSSVSEASRVRSAMHGVRFPEEASREPLFVDFVPDDMVQSWIDQETDSGFGRVSGGRRVFEVIYEKGKNDIEAVFQEADPTKRRPPFEPSLGSRMSFDRQQPATAPAGVHPDRATFVPRESHTRDFERPRAPPTGPKNSSSDAGKGFKALDELFKSTTAKPKLYYKPVSSAVAEERQDMFHALRAGYAEMGRTGDEGMKRYSFERGTDREEWVDKGPEFGQGRRGQERLVGGDRGDRGGRGRGRGGTYRGRPVDSWRAGSGR